MTTEKKTKILQVIPAERGWHARGRQEGAILKEIICWALCDDGEVWPMIEGDVGPELSRS